MKTKTILGLFALALLTASGFGQTVTTVLQGDLSEPYGIAVDRSDTNNFYYITDSVNNRVVRYQPGLAELTDLTGPIHPAGASSLGEPSGIVLARNGLVVADRANNLILYVSFGGTVSVLAGTVQGHINGPAASAAFDTPTGLAVDAAGNIFISDSRNNVIRKLSPNNTLTDYASGFNRPTGVAVGDNGVLFVADTGNHVIKLVATDGTSTVIAGTLGSNVFTDDFNEPRGVLWLGGSTGLLVSDTGNNVIRRVSNPLIGRPWATTVYAGAVAQQGTADGSLTGARFFGPVGLALDLEGSIVVADLGNNLVRVISRPAVQPLTVTPPSGQYTNNIVVSVTSSTTNATFFYTTDGSDPTPSSFPLPGNVLLLDSGGPVAFKVRGFSPDFGSSLVVSNNYSFAASPLSINVAGGSFTNDIFLSITSGTTNTVIHYTTDGTAPTLASPVWSDRIWGQSGPFNVRGFRPNYDSSPEVDLVYTFSAVAPVITPPGLGGTGFTNNNLISIKFDSGTSNVALFWTLNGAEPTTNDTRYTGPFVLGTNGTMAVKAFKAGYTDSPVTTSAFDLSVANPTISPSGTTNTDVVTVAFATTTTNASLYWTAGLSPADPTTNDTLYTGPFQLGINGTLKVRGFLNGFLPSDVVSANFTLIVSDPTISPNGATSDNVIPNVTITAATPGAQIYWNIAAAGGPDPTPSDTLYTGPFTLGTNGVLKARAFRNGFAVSGVSSANFNLAVAVPTVTPASGTSIDSVTISMATTSLGAQLLYTLDGTAPTNTSSLYAGAFTLTTNAVLSVIGFQDGFVSSALVQRNYGIQVDTPVMSPPGGYFPDGTIITLTVLRTNATIYYTLNGDDPTTNGIPYTGPFKLNALTSPNLELQQIKARAFAPNTIPSALVSGQPLATSSIGVPRSINAGVGSTVVVPIVVNLKANDVLKSIQFKVVAFPSSGAPNLTAGLRALSTTGNEFVPAVGTTTSSGTPTVYNTLAYTLSGGGIITNVLEVSALGTNANFTVNAFASIAFLAVAIPTNAPVGSSYSIQVLNPSATSDGQQHSVPLTTLSPATILVTNISYIVGDSSPGPWYNEGDFGNGDLDNADVNNAFNASLGVRVPYSFSDVFDAMDAFPEDSVAAVGGDGQIRFLDWTLILTRSLRHTTINWSRSWTTNGVRMATMITTNLVASGQLPDETIDNSVHGAAWPDFEISAVSIGDAQAGQQVSVPVEVNLLNGGSLSGLQFRAAVRPDDAAPALTAVQFVPAAGMPLPLQVSGLPPNEVAAAWSPLLNPFAQPLSKRVRIGALRFTVPAGVQPGQTYTVDFANTDGVPDLNTQYDVGSNQGSITIAGPAKPAVSAGVRGFKLQWQGTPGQGFTVESSTDLNGAWKVEADNVVARGQAVSYVDQSLSSKAKFYRIRLKL